MLCPKCGAANPEDSNFCLSCGYALGQEKAATSSDVVGSSGGGGSDVPEWLFALQKNLPEELRDPELEELARRKAARRGDAQPVPPATPGEEQVLHQGQADERPPSMAPREKGEKSEARPGEIPRPERAPEQGTETDVRPSQGSVDSPGGDELPDWLRDLRGSIQEEPFAYTEPDEHHEEDLPDWLKRHIGPYDTEAEGQTAPAPSILEDERDQMSSFGDKDIPEWLKSLEETSPGSAQGEESAPESDDVPGWLRSEREEEITPAEPESPAAAAAQEEQANRPSPSVGAGNRGEPVRPSWPTGAEEPGPDLTASEAGADEAVGTAPQDQAEDMPEWLRELGGARLADLVATEESSRIPESAEPAAEEAPQVDSGVPEWLSALRESHVPATGEDESQGEVGETAKAEPVDSSLDFDLPPLPEKDIPDWLREMVEESPAGPAALAPDELAPGPSGPEPEGEDAPQASEMTPEEMPVRGEEVPPSLRGMTEGPFEESTGPAAEESVSIPSGAESEGESAAQVPETTPGEAPVEGEEIPQWLRELREQEPFDDVEVPAWLIEPVDEAIADLGEEELPEIREETPSWLAGVRPEAEESAGEVMPDWLRDLDKREAPGTEEPLLEEAEVPDWLREMRPFDPEADEGPDVTYGEAPFAEEDVGEFAEVPAGVEPPEPWALDQGPPPQPVAGPPEEPGVTEPLRPTAHEEDEGPAGMALHAEQKGADELLGDIGGALTAETIVSSLRHRPTPLAEPLPKEAEQARALQEIVSEPLVDSAATGGPRRRQFWPWLGRMALYSLIIVVVGIPLYWQGALEVGFLSEYTIPISAKTEDFAERIDSLPVDSLVLVAFDYEPSLAEELNAQARALLRDLMKQQARILLISTTPTGPQIAENLMTRLAEESGYKYGEDYLNLGYLPGQENSLLLFGQNPTSAVRVDFRDRRALEGFTLFDQQDLSPERHLGQMVELFVSLSGSQESLRTWIEQVVTPYGVTMMAGVSGGIEAYAQPYLDFGQLAGILSGLPGAAEYEAVTQAPGLAVRSLDSQAGVHLLLAVLIVLANVVYGIGRLFGRR